MEVLGRQFRCWGANGEKKNDAARRSKATFHGGGVAGCVYAKTRRRQRWRRLALRFTSFVPSPKWLRKMSGNQ
jgi:hypothetical protein